MKPTSGEHPQNEGQDFTTPLARPLILRMHLPCDFTLQMNLIYNPQYTYMEQVDKSVLTPLMTCIPSLSKTTSYLVWSCTNWKTLFCLFGVISFTTQKIVCFVYINNTFAWMSKMVPQVKRRILKEEDDTQ